MERHGIGMISLKYQPKDYFDLHLRVDEGDWDKAIEIVDDRFRERFFSTIHDLSFDYEENRVSVSKVEKNGFAIMALNCLLIDTFYQFEYGLKSSKDKNPKSGKDGVGPNYTLFLRQKFPDIFGAEKPLPNGKDLADLFYTDIRCGILHSAQTKKRSMLACEGGDSLKYIYDRNGKVGVRVEVSALSEALEDYFEKDYLDRLRNGDKATRKAFIKKMQHVCGTT